MEDLARKRRTWISRCSWRKERQELWRKWRQRTIRAGRARS